MKVLIRADSSSEIGTGHIMRDLVLAEQYPDDDIIFAVQNLSGNINHKIEEQGCHIEILKSNSLEELIVVIEQYEVDMVIVDHYGIDYHFEKSLKEQIGVKLMVLDDTYEKHECDILLNHNIYADESRYQGLVPESCELRCGLDYLLIREEFKKEKDSRVRGDSIKRVLLALGGADTSNLNAEVLKVLQKFKHLEIDVITTGANGCLEELKSYVSNLDNLTLYIDTKSVAKLMSDADLAVLTPSVIANEAVYMELPLIAIQTAKNQKEMSVYLESLGFKVHGGFDANALAEDIFSIQTQAKLINFVDMSDFEQKMVLEWRNDSRVKSWMFNSDPISLQDHQAFICSLSSRQDARHFLVKKNDEYIGVINFTRISECETAYFGVYANPELRGVGRYLMRTIMGYAFSVLTLKVLLSEVFFDNKPAFGLYQKCGFKEVSQRQEGNRDVICMELEYENWCI